LVIKKIAWNPNLKMITEERVILEVRVYKK
jgi:hypothetical protein